MRFFISFLLIISLIGASQQQQSSGNNDTDIPETEAIFSDDLSRLADKIREQFDKLKEQIKGLFEREKRQNFDPAFQSAVSGGGLHDNFGLRIGAQSSPNARVIDRLSNAALKVSQNIAARIDGTTVQRSQKRVKGAKDRAGNRVQQDDLIGLTPKNDPVQKIAGLKAPGELCPFQKVGQCDATSRFRTFDGSCNNLQNPWWGKNETPYKRYLKAAYNDGLQEQRRLATSGNELPNPRAISRSICVDNSRTEVAYTHFLALFGQFLAHDITSVSSSTDDRGAIIDCPCGSTNPSCMSIPVQSNDGLMQSSCIKFTRSSAAFPTFDCTLGVREQLNLISSFIDATNVYGTDADRSAELRSHVGGQMISSPGVNNRPFMQQTIDGSCRDTNAKVKCFLGGEGRANENLGLLSIQTLFFRFHNKVAQDLAGVNPTWDDETLFQEARRIVIATLQHITYNEYLPAILGWNTATLFDLVPLDTNAYYTGYDQKVNPSMANEFTSAAFRFGHTLIRNSFTRANPNNQKVGEFGLGQAIFRPVEAYNAKAGGIESIMVGLLNDPAGKFDTSFADTMQNHLFEFKLPDGTAIAVDLAATNINRGRDHGIPSYNAYREKCGLKRAVQFADLIDTINSEQINKLAGIYESPDDIDLYIGGLSEKPSIGAVVGPVFSCLIASQFNDLKKGDRFYYENGPSDIAFTLAQLGEIRKMSLSRLVCDNTDINEIQPNSFLMPLASINNARVPCASIAGMNIQAWASSK